MMLNMIVGKYMLENISVVCTYQTQKLSGILRRNSYITTYNMYKKIWNLGEAKYSKHYVEAHSTRLASVRQQARCMSFDWNMILRNHIQSKALLLIWWRPRLEQTTRTCGGSDRWPTKSKASDESLALSAVVTLKLKRSFINEPSRCVVSEESHDLALARDLQNNQLEATSNIKVE